MGPLDGDAEVDVLSELRSLGLMSAILLQTIAQAACQVAPRPATEALARIGTSGDFSANAHRDLRRKLNLGNLDLNTPPPLLTDIPLRVAKQRGGLRTMVTEELRYPVMLPHEVFGCDVPSAQVRV